MTKTIFHFVKPRGSIIHLGSRYINLFLLFSLLLCLQITSACNNNDDDKNQSKAAKETAPVLNVPQKPIPTPTEPPTPTPNPTSTPSPVPTTPKLDLDVKELLANATESMENLKSFSFTIGLNLELIDDDSNLIVPFVIDGKFVAPNRSSSVISNPFLGPENSIQTIAIGKTFMKNYLGMMIGI